MGDEEGDLGMRGELDYYELTGIMEEDLDEEGPFIPQVREPYMYV